MFPQCQAGDANSVSHPALKASEDGADYDREFKAYFGRKAVEIRRPKWLESCELSPKDYCA